MTLEEAKKVAEICATADGGCSHCVDSLFKQLKEAFPQFIWKGPAKWWEEHKTGTEMWEGQVEVLER